MENSYIKTDDNKIINEKCIRWVKKMDECLEVCTRTDGCKAGLNTHKICKLNNSASYEKLNRFFIEN
jgi:hypothetical protein